MNWAPKLAWKSSSFFSLNRCSTSRCRPNTLTREWPVKASSTCAFSVPVCVHWATKRFFERLVMNLIVSSDVGMVTRATMASGGEITTMMIRTPTTVSVEVRSWLSVCWRL